MATKLPFEEGPYLSAAFLCEKVLEERDGVKSAIRIIDRLYHSPIVGDPNEKMKPFLYLLTLLIKLKSGWARGSHPLKIELVKPSAEVAIPLQRMLNFEGDEDRGVDIMAQINIMIDMTGIYWFKIYINDIGITQIPFRVIYVPQVRQIRGSSGGPPPTQDSPPSP